MIGGIVPGGMRRRIVCETAVTWAIAEATSVPGCKKTRMTETPSKLWLSSDLIPATLPEMLYSENWVICCSTCCAASPPYVHTTLMTGMSTTGKMSVGVRRTTWMPASSIRIDITTNV